MIKVTVTSHAEVPIARVEGAIDQAGAGELRRAVNEPARGRPGRIDLSGVTSVDCAGATLIRTLQADGWELANASLYIATLLQESQSCPRQP